MYGRLTSMQTNDQEIFSYPYFSENSPDYKSPIFHIEGRADYIKESETILFGVSYSIDNDLLNTLISENKIKILIKLSCRHFGYIKTFVLESKENSCKIPVNSIDVDGNKVDAYTTYEIGSLTKAFTATAVLQLCEQGKITLDDTLDKYFPEYEYGKDITIYQLLHMQHLIPRQKHQHQLRC